MTQAVRPVEVEEHLDTLPFQPTPSPADNDSSEPANLDPSPEERASEPVSGGSPAKASSPGESRRRTLPPRQQKKSPTCSRLSPFKDRNSRVQHPAIPSQNNQQRSPGQNEQLSLGRISQPSGGTNISFDTIMYR